MTALLFQITLLHPFFTDGVFDDCQLTPDAATGRTIAHYQLSTRRAEGTFALYTSFQRSAADFMQYLVDTTGNAPLRFVLACNNRRFVFITDVPPDWVGQVSLNSTTGAVQTGDRQATVTLTPELQSAAGMEGMIGEVLIYPADVLALLAQGVSTIAYNARFAVRSLHWIYTVINRSQTKLYQPAVRGRDGACFTGPVAKTMADGETALEFSSGATQFALQQVPTILFDLVDTAPVDNVVMTGLPTPQPGQFGSRQSGASSYDFAEMYVYL